MKGNPGPVEDGRPTGRPPISANLSFFRLGSANFLEARFWTSLGLPTTRQEPPWVLLFEKLDQQLTHFFRSFLLYPMPGSFHKVCA